MICPHCSGSIPDKLIRSEAGRLAGAAGKGQNKSRPSNQMRAAANKRWDAVRAEMCETAFLAGRMAARHGSGREKCPHGGNEDTAKMLRGAWLAGWDRGRRSV